MLVVLFAIVVVASIAAGWIQFRSGPDRSVIEIETKQMQDAGQRTIDDANRGLKRLQDNTGKALENAGEAIREDAHDSTTSPPEPVTVPQRPLPQPLAPEVTPGPPVAPEVVP